MSMKTRLVAFAITFLLGISLCGGEALAKKRVVVLPFSGSGAASARGGVVSALRRRVRLINSKTYSRTASRLRVSRSGAGMVSICSKLKCSAIVRGKVQRRRRRYTVTVTVYNGATGRPIGRRASSVRGRRRLRRAGAAIARRVLRLIRKGRYKRGRHARPQPQPQPQPATPPPTPAVTPDQPRPTPKPNADLDRALGRDHDRGRDRHRDDDDDDDDDGRVSRRRHHGKYYGIFDVSAAIGLSTRSFSLVPQDGSVAHNYSGGMFPEFTLELETYPLVLATRSFAKNIGLGLSYTRHISISTKLDSTNTTANADSAVSTTSQELMVNARLRWALNDDLAGMVFYGYAGFGMRGFSLSQNVVLTSVAYQFVHIGLGGRIPLGSPFISLRAEATVRPLIQVGL
ncbi:MAG: hypothetical protein KAI47_06155, partial [Deltaproteobacteria bacterium]|nr:hypothetical protein [Deltaproteobacteria bacterium]